MMCHWNRSSYDSTNVLFFLEQTQIQDQEQVLLIIGVILGAFITMKIFCLYESSESQHQTQGPDTGDYTEEYDRITNMSFDFDEDHPDDRTADASEQFFESDDFFADKMVDRPTEDDILSMIEGLKLDLSEMSNIVRHLVGGGVSDEALKDQKCEGGFKSEGTSSEKPLVNTRTTSPVSLEMSLVKQNGASSNSLPNLPLKSSSSIGKYPTESSVKNDISTQTEVRTPYEIEWLEKMENIRRSVTEQYVAYCKSVYTQTSNVHVIQSSAPTHDTPRRKVESLAVNRFKQFCADIENASLNFPSDSEPQTESSSSTTQEYGETNKCARNFLESSKEVNREELSKIPEIEKLEPGSVPAIFEDDTNEVFENSNRGQQTRTETPELTNETQQRSEILEKESSDLKCAMFAENKKSDDFNEPLSEKNEKTFDWFPIDNVPVEFLYACSPIP